MTKINNSISLIIPTKDRSTSLKEALKACLNQRVYPAQIVIVDQNEYPFADRAMIDQVRSLGIEILIIHDNKISSLPQARNIGVSQATGDIICFIDDDCSIAQSYFYYVSLLFKGNPSVYGIGGFLIDKKQNSRSFLYKLLFKLFCQGPFYDEAQVFYWEPSTFFRSRFLHGASMSFRKEVFDRYKFSEDYRGYSMGEDREFCLRISKEYDLILSSFVVCSHNRSPQNRYDNYRYFRSRVVSEYYIFRDIINRNPKNAILFVWYCLGLLFRALLSGGVLSLEGFLAGVYLLWKIKTGIRDLLSVLESL